MQQHVIEITTPTKKQKIGTAIVNPSFILEVLSASLID